MTQLILLFHNYNASELPGVLKYHIARQLNGPDTSGYDIYTLLLLFAIYSFSGWLLEVIYRSVTNRKFVNAGFLHGPFVPIYGFGAVGVILLNGLFGEYSIALRFTAFGFAITFVEYVTGSLFEGLFKLKLWDYSDSRFNLHGKVCLHFSAAWTVLAIIFLIVIQPLVYGLIHKFGKSEVTIAALIVTVYLSIDFLYSFLSMNKFKRITAYMYSEFLSIGDIENEKIFGSIKRLLRAFPYLRSYIDININKTLKTGVNTLLKSLDSRIKNGIKKRKPLEQEYLNIVKDILNHEEFLKLKNYFHHNSSIYDHVLDVSYVAYKICKYLQLDYVSAARGGLLHDFFLYDWRNHDLPDLAKEKFHGLHHPGIALLNSEKYFSLNEIEKDIIVKHMWPLTLIPPRYRESFIVTFTDKYISSREYIYKIKKSYAAEEIDIDVKDESY